MAECFEKNMIDKDEYPVTAEIESRCVSMLADLWHAPADETGDGLLDARLLGGVHARGARVQAPLAGSSARGRTDPAGRTW